jgi:hypothetical protein
MFDFVFLGVVQLWRDNAFTLAGLQARKPLRFCYTTKTPDENPFPRVTTYHLHTGKHHHFGIITRDPE